MSLRCHRSYLEIPADAWDALVPPEQPFLRHGFFASLEESGCVGARTGWLPAPVTLHAADGRVLAAIPGWLKQHSRGEYVFDQGWAEAAMRAGLAYYPKWLSAVPFSPVVGPRLLGEPAAAAALLTGLAALPELTGVSGWHINFTDAGQDAILQESAGWLHRRDCQYHWLNREYATFADFTAQLKSDRRKKIRQERDKLAALALDFDWVSGDAADEALLDSVFACYANTYHVRDQQPYLTRAFFTRLCERLPGVVQILCVRREGRLIAMALFLAGSETLYGRYWGCIEDVPLLHFEACLYRGIEFAIAQGFRRFDAGAQGEHKLLRGFEPVLTSSWHRLAHPGLHRAVGEFLLRERRAVSEYQQMAAAACPYRSPLS